MGAGPILELRDLDKHFGAGERRRDVLAGVDLAVRSGEFVAILGHSGIGKTTLISLMGGLIRPDGGSALFDGAEIAGPGRERAIVFQNYSLMPWLTVAGNVRLAVDAAHRDKPNAERRALVERYVGMVGLAHAASRRPAELSGGMRQRVAVARALAMEPRILLLDEPLSALDALTRGRLQDEFAAIAAAPDRTVVLITNDVDEAVLLADRVIPLVAGGRGASLGPEFRVDAPRPRDRATLETDDRLIGLRRDITNCLLAANAGKPPTDSRQIALPNVVPIRRGAPEPLPAAYHRAAGKGSGEGYVEFSQVGKTFATARGPLTIVDGFDLKLSHGEFVSIIGHSGCGKSTVLSMAAGLTSITSGGIILDNREVADAGPERAVVFQAPSLLPWLTARENVALGVDRVYPGASPAERRDVVEYYLQRVGLGDAMHRRAAELSNGMKQRVGIARAFALSPKLLLLDEPFGMLDSLTRWELQEVLMEVWARTRVTAICVTHDVDEAILLADRVVMMTNGPHARIGDVMAVDLPRPRSRQSLFAHRDYAAYRKRLLDFLDAAAEDASSPAAVRNHDVPAIAAAE